MSAPPRERLAALCTIALLSCGGQAHLARSGPTGGASARDGGPDAGAGPASSSGGRTSLDAALRDAGTGGVAGGSGTEGRSGSSGTDGGGAAGGGAEDAVAPPDPEADAGSPLMDPEADRRRSLAEQYCSVCGSTPDCASELEIEWFNDDPSACWDELVASATCSMTNGSCTISGGQIGSGPCLAERNALEACLLAHYVSGTITGTTTTCFWNRSSSGTACQIQCGADPNRFYSTDCSGPPNGPFSCWCELNGRALIDSMISNGARFFVDECSEAGQLLADGYCNRFVDCCYTFTGVLQQGLVEQTLCECTSDPTYGGQFSSCEALAASHPDGKVVDLCPAYLPAPVVPGAM